MPRQTGQSVIAVRRYGPYMYSPYM